MPLYVVDTVHDEPLTVRVEDRPPWENIPTGWQTQVDSPASSLPEQHVRAPLLPLLLLLHASTSPSNRARQTDVVRFIDPTPPFDGKTVPASHISENLAGVEVSVGPTQGVTCWRDRQCRRPLRRHSQLEPPYRRGSVRRRSAQRGVPASKTPPTLPAPYRHAVARRVRRPRARPRARTSLFSTRYTGPAKVVYVAAETVVIEAASPSN
jgi:hypothetical protein